MAQIESPRQAAGLVAACGVLALVLSMFREHPLFGVGEALVLFALAWSVTHDERKVRVGCAVAALVICILDAALLFDDVPVRPGAPLDPFRWRRITPDKVRFVNIAILIKVTADLVTMSSVWDPKPVATAPRAGPTIPVDGGARRSSARLQPVEPTRRASGRLAVPQPEPVPAGPSMVYPNCQKRHALGTVRCPTCNVATFQD